MGTEVVEVEDKLIPSDEIPLNKNGRKKGTTKHTNQTEEEGGVSMTVRGLGDTVCYICLFLNASWIFSVPDRAGTIPGLA